MLSIIHEDINSITARHGLQSGFSKNLASGGKIFHKIKE